MNSILYKVLVCIGIAGLCFSSTCFAHGSVASNGIRLPQTRVILTSDQTSATATIQNRGDQVYLVKAGIITTPEDSATQTPFTIIPPLFRLEPHNQQTIKIVRHGSKSLPSDRESLFYLSFLAIPTLAEDDHNQMRLSVGIQTVIKMFYRPMALPLSRDNAVGKLRFSQQDSVLQVSNPTPYYLTLGSLKADDHSVDIQAQGQMISPFSRRNLVHAKPAKRVTWTVINDYGGLSAEQHSQLVPQGKKS